MYIQSELSAPLRVERMNIGKISFNVLKIAYILR
jgi:hypothetical protein